MLPNICRSFTLILRKGQRDVCGTLLLLHELALTRRTLKPLVAGCRAISENLAWADECAPHLGQIRMQ